MSGRTTIIACSTLADYVDAAQRTRGTDHPVVLLDRNLHVDPDRMSEHILETIASLPADVGTVLVAMGFCGGSWEGVSCARRLVIPRIDDCVSLVMTTTGELKPDMKRPGRMYMFGAESGGFSISGIYEGLERKYGGEVAEDVFEMMFANYSGVDIIDTGVYDCRAPGFVAKARWDADLIGAELGMVSGGNLLLEKLVSGEWDAQFLVVEPGVRITRSAVLGS